MHNIFRNLQKSDGEIIYYETGGTGWEGSVAGVEGTQVALDPVPDYAKLAVSAKQLGNVLPRQTLFITEGKGMGQFRSIVGTGTDGVTVDRPWDSVPDATSHVVILAGAVVENLHVGNEFYDSHQWVGIYGAGVRNAWVNDLYDRVSGGTDLWKIHGLRQMSLNLIYCNKYHERAGIAIVNDRFQGGETPRLQVFGNEVRNCSLESRAYVSTENGQNAPRLIGQVRAPGKSSGLAPLPGLEPGLSIYDSLGHPEMGPPINDPALDKLESSTQWNLFYGNQVARCPIGLEIGKAVRRTLVLNNLFLECALPVNNMGRDTLSVGNMVYTAQLPVQTFSGTTTGTQ
jgi:hypothetical protein